MTAIRPEEAFALLADGAELHLFRDPRGVIAGGDMALALREIRAAAAAGDWLAGGFSYESGLQLEPRLQTLGKAPAFHWFGRFPPPQAVGPAAFEQIFASWRRNLAAPVATPLIARAQWLGMVERAQQLIARGDIYQANLSFPMQLALDCHPLTLFAQLFSRQAAPHGGLVHDGAGRWWLSISPELFFRLTDGRIEARPMKGTAPRQPALAADRAMAEWLRRDAKNRAENLMITDLLRNDISRVARTGSVRTSTLFEVETYPSVHQMTSAVEARLQPQLDACDVIRALYPCGSVTGAPKIRALQVIDELEGFARGIYCGSIGWIAPGARSAHFNVAIRTITVVDNGRAQLNVGAGITADSDAASEWRECLLKGQFLKPARPASLLETMRLEAGGGIPRLPLHFDRLAASAQRFAFAFDRQTVTQALQGLRPATARRLRLQLWSDGKYALQQADLPQQSLDTVNVGIVPLPLDPADWRLWHKVGAREFHDQARQASGCFECVYERADGLLTEGSFTNIFVDRDGLLLTPPASLGLLPGVLRAELLQTGRAREALLRRADLQQGFWIGNSLRGLTHARLAG